MEGKVSFTFSFYFDCLITRDHLHVWMNKFHFQKTHSIWAETWLGWGPELPLNTRYPLYYMSFIVVERLIKDPGISKLGPDPGADELTGQNGPMWDLSADGFAKIFYHVWSRLRACLEVRPVTRTNCPSPWLIIGAVRLITAYFV
jgi:hypothetical protein